jgi:hypothetical protein
MPLFNARHSPYSYAGGGHIIGTDGQPVAYLAGRMNDGNADVTGKVMAASVDLYQALYALLEYPADKITLAQARAALAKARGENSCKSNG